MLSGVNTAQVLRLDLFELYVNVIRAKRIKLKSYIYFVSSASVLTLRFAEVNLNSFAPDRRGAHK